MDGEKPQDHNHRMNHIKTNKGFTLLEMTVAMTLFIVIVALTSGLFVRTLRTQRVISEISKTLDDATLAIEQMSREIRVGYGFPQSNSEEAQSSAKVMSLFIT